MVNPLTSVMFAVQVMKLLKNLREKKMASSHLDLCDNSEAEDGNVEEYNQEEKYTFEEDEEEIIKVEEKNTTHQVKWFLMIKRNRKHKKTDVGVGIFFPFYVLGNLRFCINIKIYQGLPSIVRSTLYKSDRRSRNTSPTLPLRLDLLKIELCHENSFRFIISLSHNFTCWSSHITKFQSLPSLCDSKRLETPEPKSNTPPPLISNPLQKNRFDIGK
ncbi:LOW QUALITY PROTEIN: hypothetical protein YC2023_090618 [Brassica napus]